MCLLLYFGTKDTVLTSTCYGVYADVSAIKCALILLSGGVIAVIGEAGNGRERWLCGLSFFFLVFFFCTGQQKKSLMSKCLPAKFKIEAV